MGYMLDSQLELFSDLPRLPLIYRANQALFGLRYGCPNASQKHLYAIYIHYYSHSLSLLSLLSDPIVE